MQEREQKCILLVVDIEQDEAEEYSQHCGKDEARSVVGHIAQIALPEPAAQHTSLSVGMKAQRPHCNAVLP